MDSPLTREKGSINWAGQRGRYHRHLISKLLDRNHLTLDIEKDRFGRTAVITDAGRQALLQSP